MFVLFLLYVAFYVPWLLILSDKLDFKILIISGHSIPFLGSYLKISYHFYEVVWFRITVGEQRDFGGRRYIILTIIIITLLIRWRFQKIGLNWSTSCKIWSKNQPAATNTTSNNTYLNLRQWATYLLIEFSGTFFLYFPSKNSCLVHDYTTFDVLNGEVRYRKEVRFIKKITLIHLTVIKKRLLCEKLALI